MVLFDKNSILVRQEMQSKSVKITNGKKASGIQGNNMYITTTFNYKE